jgi:hypothetical protein
MMSGDRRFCQVYQIRVQGRLNERWSDWFSGLAIDAGGEAEDPPITTLTGALDQAALRGVLSKVWDLNLALVSVVRLEETANSDG